MKKSLSLILSALTLASALTACAPAADQLNPAITLASSGAKANAEWLNDRLDVIPDDVVIGIGSNSAYGIDMTNFEDDGYIARAIGDEVLLFGKTADGLDRAVREYAKAADKGATALLDTVYHEDKRIEKLTIAGRDISEYTVVYNYDSDYNNDTDPNIDSRFIRTVGNAKYAAEEFVRLVANATGITLPTATEDVTSPMIRIDYITDTSRKKNSFEYKVESGNLYINGAPDANGCANGVYYFLEYECGWDGLMYGDSDLQEAQLVDVPEGTSASIDPIFDQYIRMNHIYRFPYENDRAAFSQAYCGIINKGSHGMQTEEWSGIEGTRVFYYQICYTNESNYQNTLGSVYDHVKRQVDSGMVIGEDITTVDISQGDNFNYCKCKDCTKVYKEEGQAHSGAVVRFANRLAADMEADGCGGLAYQIFAYHGTNKPCITKVRDDVYVTYCNDGSCANHPLDGSECVGSSFDMAGLIPGMETLNNKNYAEWMKGWGEIAENVYVWYYLLDNNFGQYTYFDLLYDDVMLIKEAGFAGLHLEQENFGLGIGKIRMQLFNLLIYNPDVTEAEYEVMRDEIMKREYGEGYDFVLDYIGIWRETERNSGCWNSWGYGDLLNIGHYDTEMYSARADEMIELLEKARKLASCEAQDLSIQRLILEVAYRQCVTTYFKAYDADDMEMIAHLEDRYELFVEYSLNNEYSLDSHGGALPGVKFALEDNLEAAAWVDWIEWRDDLTPEGTTQKPMPDVWAEWYATSTEAS